MHNVLEPRPEKARQCLPVLVQGGHAPLVAEELVPLHEMDAEEQGDAVKAVLDVRIHLLDQELGSLAYKKQFLIANICNVQNCRNSRYFLNLQTTLFNHTITHTLSCYSIT